MAYLIELTDKIRAMNDSLKSCPFCGQGNQVKGFDMCGVFIATNEDGNARFVECDNCQCQGPWFTAGEEIKAVMAWNSCGLDGWQEVEEFEVEDE